MSKAKSKVQALIKRIRTDAGWGQESVLSGDQNLAWLAFALVLGMGILLMIPLCAFNHSFKHDDIS